MPYWFDGNNLIGQPVARARADRNTRRAFLAELSGYARTRGGRFVVFFDGDDPDRSVPPTGVQVRYSAPVSTDALILQRLAETRTPGETIVVTNDRSLQATCRAAGAKVLNWEEFCNRMKPKSRVGRRLQDREEKVDLEEWTRYFGLKKDTLN